MEHLVIAPVSLERSLINLNLNCLSNRENYKDVNECDDDPCGANARCTNLPASFNCTCKAGFIGDAYDNCTGRLYSPVPSVHMS
jgi:hypothetical protein